MVRKSKRIQSIQRRQSSRTTKPRAAPLATITTSPAPSSHAPSPTAKVHSKSVVEKATVDGAQCHDTEIASVAPEGTSGDITLTGSQSRTAGADQSLDVDRNVEELRLDPHSGCDLAEQEEEELLQRYLEGSNTTSRPVGSPSPELSLGVLGFVQTQPEVDVLPPRSRSISESETQVHHVSEETPDQAVDHTLEKIQNSISSLISLLSTESDAESNENSLSNPPTTTHSSPNSNTIAEALSTILTTAPTLLTQLEVIFCTACYERITALEKERNTISEDIARSKVEREMMLRRIEKLEERVRVCRKRKRKDLKTRFVDGC